MAKQYISGVSGLLTESNPVDAPSNTLSQAENVIVDQDGKVQSRHGLNINQDEASSPFAADSNETIVALNNRSFIPPIGNPDIIALDDLGYYTHYSSFFNQSGVFFKIIEFRKSNDDIVSGLFVKQKIRDYITTQSGSDINYLYKNSLNTDNVNRYFEISANSGKLIQMNELEYKDVTNVFANKLSLYLQTENGLADANVDDVFEPTANRFFDIRWPAFPKISHTFTQSTIFANWLPSNHKVGIQLTFYREMGYTDKEEEIYESQPSTLYEILNTGKDCIPVITLDLLSSIDQFQLYKKWNEFSKLNNGRKFGIKIYRTKTVPIGQVLPVDLYECYEPIRFDNALSGTIEFSDAVDNYEWFRFIAPSFSTTTDNILNIGDIITYIPSNTDIYGNVDAFNIISHKNEVRYFDNNLYQTVDLIPLRLKVSNRRIVSGGIYEYQFMCLTDSNNIKADFYVKKDTLLSTRFYTQIQVVNGSINLQFMNLEFPGSTHRFPLSTIDKPSILRFIDVAPTPFLLNTNYHIVSNNSSLTRLSTTIGGTPIAATQDAVFAISTIQVSSHRYVNEQYFTRTYNLQLDLNDESLDDVGSPLYTNTNSDSSFYTNNIAPDSQTIIQYKDIYAHIGLKKPLEASISVITLPTVEQHKCVPYIGSNFYASGTANFVNGDVNITIPTYLETNSVVYFSTNPPSPFLSNTYYYVVAYNIGLNKIQLSNTKGGTALSPYSSGTATIHFQRWDYGSGNYLRLDRLWYDKPSELSNSNLLNGVLYVESPIISDRRYRVDIFNESSPTILNYSLMKLRFTFENDMSLSTSILNADHYYLSENASFNLTLFERPYLTLQLESTDGSVHNFVIQTEPLYNRRGYYALKNESDELDQQYLTYDLSLEEMNAFRKSSQNNIIRSGLDNIYHVVGEKEGQVSADGTYNATTERWINDAAGDVYYNKDANTLLIKNAGNIDIKKFESPGIIMIQSNQTDIILFTYSFIDVSQSTANTYTFKSVALQYVSRNNQFVYNASELNQKIVSTPNYFKIKGLTYFFFLKGTTVDELDLYPYAKDITISSLYGTSITITSTNTIIQEHYTPSIFSNINNPTFTLLPHRKMSNIPVGIFNRSKNYTFLGLNAKDKGEYLDLYAWQIINLFNIELQKKNFRAYLRKGEGIGEIIISYPDGKSIKMKNGYNDGYGDKYPGNHTFLPALNKLEFIEIAKREEYDDIENNQVAISRRNIPEITPLGSVVTVGKANKKFIGAASNSDDLYIFKEDGIFRITDSGDVSSNIPFVSVYQFSTNLICQAEGSIKEINDEIIFLSQYGFMSINNGSISNISGPIQRDILTLIQVSPKDRIRAFVNESKQLYYCTLINEVDSSLNVKSGTYIFNTKTRQWTFMDQEIIDGIEDSEKRNLVAYRQKAILGTSNGTSSWYADGNTHKLISCDISFPMQTTEVINNFYMISRERHTDNIMFNAKDQYDYISENLLETGTFGTTLTGFTVTIPVSQNAFIFHYAQKLFKMFTPPTTINISGNNYAIVDSPLQLLSNREIYAEMIQTTQTTKEYYQVKITKFEYLNMVNYSIRYTFEYLTSNIPINGITLQSLKLVAGIPAKITFNPESGNNPDSNKLFQEYMIHTETNNKSAIMSFKTDSRSNFSNDRRFAYDPATTNRNVFRTYIPTNSSRGRYLIRQVKHNVPLENLIITGQTIVMRDSASTRVQKDED